MSVLSLCNYSCVQPKYKDEDKVLLAKLKKKQKNMLNTATKIWSNNCLPFYALIIYVGFRVLFEHLTGFELDFVTSVL